MFLRLHNIFARQLKRVNPHWSGEIIFQETRMILSSIHQKIHFQDYVPLIIGQQASNNSKFWLNQPLLKIVLFNSSIYWL